MCNSLNNKTLGSNSRVNEQENLNDNLNYSIMKKSNVKANSTEALNAAEKELLQQLTYGGYAEFELTPDQKRLAREWAKQGLVERHRCSITKAHYYGFGHNAAPFEGRCCNYANRQFVIPARMELLQQGMGW